jgi:hypothetical protein
MGHPYEDEPLQFRPTADDLPVLRKLNPWFNQIEPIEQGQKRSADNAFWETADINTLGPVETKKRARLENNRSQVYLKKLRESGYAVADAKQAHEALGAELQATKNALEAQETESQRELQALHKKIKLLEANNFRLRDERRARQADQERAEEHGSRDAPSQPTFSFDPVTQAALVGAGLPEAQGYTAEQVLAVILWVHAAERVREAAAASGEVEQAILDDSDIIKTPPPSGSS